MGKAVRGPPIEVIRVLTVKEMVRVKRFARLLRTGASKYGSGSNPGG